MARFATSQDTALFTSITRGTHVPETVLQTADLCFQARGVVRWGKVNV